ncbi:DUF4917 family protein, partial [Pseudomonas syringae]|uniref:DUF4917 family protein n=1 Tax=Pseudomonas syringae TaxID=317 RepID=UPI001E426F00
VVPEGDSNTWSVGLVISQTWPEGNNIYSQTYSQVPLPLPLPFPQSGLATCSDYGIKSFYPYGNVRMARKLLIFGNGIGMATDPQHFSLARAMGHVWETPGILLDAHKHLICRCTGIQGQHPIAEDNLDVLHQVVTACRMLNGIAEDEVHWLSEDGRQFPDAIARYLHKVAISLHEYEGPKNEEFFASLSNFVMRTNSHVATLNYDKLIYSHFIQAGVLSGFNGSLVDGITTGSGFSEDNLERRWSNTFGYYMHLHGSPLFFDHLESVYKLSRGSLHLGMEEFGRHIVLTHVQHKTSVINSSSILSSYWKYLSRAITEVENIVLFGYSGLDNHLNDLLRSTAADKHIKIVEWDGDGVPVDQRAWFWSLKLGKQVQIVRLPNITEFNDW